MKIDEMIAEFDHELKTFHKYLISLGDNCTIVEAMSLLNELNEMYILRKIADDVEEINKKLT